GRHLIVDELADRLAELDAPAILGDALLLLGELAEGEAEAAEPAVGGIELGARARHRHPHRRVWPLIDFRQDRAARHRPELALELELLRRPHPRQTAHELVPALLRDVRARVEPGQLGPRRRAARADLDAAAREDIEHRRALGDLDRVVELGHADDDAEADPDA